jgi:3-oxoadipate enol-lactonase
MKIEANQIHINFETHGQGQPAIFLHGYPFDHTIWDAMLPFLSGRIRSILPDLRGFGQTDAPNGMYTMRQHADDVAGLMDALGIEKAVLVGHSLGGYIALAFAQAYPQRLSGIGMVATQAVADTPEQRYGRYATAEKVLKEGSIVAAEMMPPIVTADPELQVRLRELILQAQPQGIAGTLKGMAERPNFTGDLPQIQAPVEIVAGENDRGIPLERSREMEKLFPNAHLVVIPNAGHMVMMEAPQLTAEAINRLFR